MRNRDFNTSHVTVYLDAECYGKHCAKFQYISCYGLSFSPQDRSQEKKNFNTSHVTVYQDVTLYIQPSYLISIHLMLRFIRRQIWKDAGMDFISIHLMLRFISAHMFLYACASSFQYISCYGLSKASMI